MVARVERVEFGRYGCLGCTRRSAPVVGPVDCDAPPDEHAPSLSFVFAYPVRIPAISYTPSSAVGGHTGVSRRTLPLLRDVKGVAVARNLWAHD